MNINHLSRYLGGVIEFVKQCRIDDNKTYAKNDMVRITPAILWLIASGKIQPVKDFKPHLRQINQLSDGEAINIARLAYQEGDSVININPQVTRNTSGAVYTIEVHVKKDVSVVINETYNVAVCEKLEFQGLPPVLTFIAAKRQVEIIDWFLNKHFDIYKFVKKGEAFARATWGEDDYGDSEN